MRKNSINVSDEYLDTLCDWIRDFCNQEDSYTIPEFLHSKGISYSYLRYFAENSEKVATYVDLMKSTLFVKWLKLAMKAKEMPQHRAKVLMRYLRLYDSHAMHMEEEMKKRIAEVKTIADNQYFADNYAGENLREPYREVYDHNVDKRRGSSQA